MSDTPVIATEGLTKDYGEGRGVFDLDLAVMPGEVFGYLGPNGAGKSTTIRMLLDMVRPTRGRAWLFGEPVERGNIAVRSRIAYVPGELNLWTGWSAHDIISYLGQLHGGLDRTRLEELADRFQLDLRRVVGELSKGNKQKVGLVAAFAQSADLLVLDEPTSGLDPLLQVEFQKLVRETADQGAAVLLSSHVLSEVEHAADRVGIIRRGHLVDVLSVAELKAQASRTLEVTFEHDAPDGLDDVVGVTELARAGATATYRTDGTMDPLVKALAGHTVLALRADDGDLEEVFLTYYADEERREGAA